MIEKVKTWIMENKTLAIVIGAIAILFFLPRFFRSARRKRRKRPVIKTSPVRKKRNYNKSVPGKKAWQIKGSLAAKRRMAQIRKMKS